MVKNPDPVDIHVGARIRYRRKMLRLSQTALSRKLGLTFQQIQKYEKGANRVGAGRLYQIACLLQVEGPGWFFEGLPCPASGSASANVPDLNLYENRETTDAVTAYYAVKDSAVRKSILKLIRALGQSDDLGTKQPEEGTK